MGPSSSVLRSPRTMNESLSQLETNVSTAKGCSEAPTERSLAERRRSVRLAVPQILAQSAALRDAAPSLLQVICESLGWDLGVLWIVDRNARVLRCLDVWHTAAARASEFENASRLSAFAP